MTENLSRRQVHDLSLIVRERQRRRGKADPSEFAKTLGFQADPWQEAVFVSDADRLLLNCPRQSGKSTCAALLAIWVAYYHPNSLILIVAPSQRQSGLMVQKIQTALARLPVPATLKTDSKTEIQFTNGSRIVSLPADEAKIRGYSAVSLMILDEAGDVPDDLFKAVLPMLVVSRGRLLVMGTPKGCRGFFFEKWIRGGDSWERHRVPWQEVPRFNVADIERQRIELGALFPQEFEGAFLSLKGGMVFPAYTEACEIESLPESNGAGEWVHLLGIDFGYVDATAFTIVGWRLNDPVLYVLQSMKETGLLVHDIARIVKEFGKTYKFSRIIGDIGGFGKLPAEELLPRFGIRVEAAPKTGKVGFVDLLNGAFATGLVKIVRPGCIPLIKELVELPWNDDRTEFRAGSDDHCADSLLYSWRVSSTYLQKPAQEPLSRFERIHADTEEHFASLQNRQTTDWWEHADDTGEIRDEDYGL